MGEQPIYAHTAEEFWGALPEDHEDPARVLALRELWSKARNSESARELVCEVYRAASEGRINVSDVYDLRSLCCSVTDAYDLLPLVRAQIEEIVRRYALGHSEPYKLWLYIQENYAARTAQPNLVTLARKQARRTGSRRRVDLRLRRGGRS